MEMTIDTCVKMLIAKEKCMEQETSGIDIDCNSCNCENCSLCYEQGTEGEQKEALLFAVDIMHKYQNMQEVLDKIKTEIFNACSDSYHMPIHSLSCDEIFEIIDKCKAESEDKE